MKAVAEVEVVTPSFTLAQIIPLLEQIIENQAVHDSKLEQLSEEIKSQIVESQSAIEEKIDDIEFNENYPGFDQ